MVQKKKTIYKISVAVIVAIFVWGIWFFSSISDLQKSSENTFRVVASFYPYAYFAQQVGGDYVKVTNITPVGSEPHDYELTPKDIIEMENSNLLILNGSLEAWGKNMKQNLSSKNTEVLEVGENIIDHYIVEDGKNVLDPHIWLSPQYAKKIVDKIFNAYIEIDPLHKGYYQENRDLLQQKLNNLDQNYIQSLANCRQKDIITSHAAFGYMVGTYGLTQVSIAGLSPEIEPSAQELSSIVEFAKRNKIEYIFFESLASNKLSNTLAQEVGAQTLVLNPLEGLTKDEINSGEDYFTIMKKNLDQLKIALQCQ